MPSTPSRPAVADASLYEEVRQRFSAKYKLRYGAGWEDALHDTFIALLTAEHSKTIRNTTEYMFGISRHQWFQYLRKVLRERTALATRPPDISPAWANVPSERIAAAALLDASLEEMTPREQEIMTRSLRGDPRLDIIHDLHLTDVQYRIAKSRGLAKAKLNLSKLSTRRLRVAVDRVFP